MSKLLYTALLLVGFVVLFQVGKAWKLKPETKYDHSPYRGEVAVLKAAGTNDSVRLAYNKDDCYSLNLAMIQNDTGKLRSYEDNKSAFAVPAGTRVKVVGESVSRKQVQVLEGPLEGKTGWVEAEYIRARQPGEFGR